MWGILISGPANRFSSFRSWKKISFHRPVSVRKHRWNLVKGVLDHLWAILAVYLCIFFLSYSKIGRRRGKVFDAAQVESCFRLEAGLYPKEERKRQKTMGWGSQKDICGERRPWKLEEYKVYVCVFVGIWTTRPKDNSPRTISPRIY